MMGIPSIDLTPSGQPDASVEDEGVRKTMFGFPVNEVVSEVFDEGTDAYEESATQIVDADQFMLDESLNPGAFEAPKFVERSSPMRSTVSGGMPSLAQLQAAHESSEVSEAEEDDSANTMVGSASMFQFDGAADEVQPPPAKSSPKLHDRPRKHETLMGMSLDDLAPQSAKHTLFSIPTHDDMGEGLSEFSEDESDVEEDIPTQAISGAIFAQEPVQDATREQNRQRLLDKLRANNKSDEEERPTRSTMFGIPAVSGDISSDEDEDERAPSLTPHTGVLKVARKGAGLFTEPSESAIEKSSSGVLGSSSYMLNKDSTATEESVEVKKPLPSLNLSRSLRDKLAAATAAPSTSPPPATVTPLEVSPDEEDKTQVVTGELLKQALGDSRESSAQSPPHLFDTSGSGLAQESAPTVQGDSLIVEDDMTREQNISDLHIQLRQSSEQAAVPRKHFNEDATRQHDLASIREQLGDDLFALTPSEASEGLMDDATAVAPSLDEVNPPRSNTGPLFATSRPQQDVHELETVANAPKLKFDEAPGLHDLPVEALPALDVSPLDPYSSSQQPFIPVTPMAPEEPAGVVDLPMIDAVPLPMEPAYKTVTTTSTPTPPHGTQLPSQVPAQPLPASEGDVGRTFQVLFGLLGAACFLCATVLPVAGVAMPEGQALSAMVYAPLALALLALLGALLPMNKVRQGLLILTTLLGIGLFAMGLLLAMPIILSILSLVGALFALTAILFPIFARSM